MNLEYFNEQKKKYLAQNFIILRGRIYSKKQVQQMKKFFDQIDVQKKGFITIDDYVTHANGHSALDKISNSLFKHFDREGTGFIAFEDMLQAMVPGAQDGDIDRMMMWVASLNKENKIYGFKKESEQKDGNAVGELMKNNNDMDEVDSFLSSSTSSIKSPCSKLALPGSKKSAMRRNTRKFSISPTILKKRAGAQSVTDKSCCSKNGMPFVNVTQEMISELRNIFELYDAKKKGYLSREEFIKSLSGLYDLENIIGRMKEFGYENERYIRIDQFIKMVVPANYVVPEAVLDNLQDLYRNKFQIKESNGPFTARESTKNVVKISVKQLKKK